MRPEGVPVKSAPAKKGKALTSPLTREQALELLKEHSISENNVPESVVKQFAK